MATGGKVPARRAASSAKTSGAIDVVTRAAVGSARASAKGARLARTWQDVAVPAVGAAALLGFSGTAPTDIVLTSTAQLASLGALGHASVVAVTAGSAARYLACSPHAQGRRERRKFLRTLRRLGIAEPPSAVHPRGQPPRVLLPEITRTGSKIVMQIPEGLTGSDMVARMAPALERNFGQASARMVAPPPSIRSGTVARARRALPGSGVEDGQSAVEYGWVEFSFRRRDGVSGPAPGWRHLAEMRAEGFAGLLMWDGIHVGTDENADPIDLTLTQRNLLTAGEPGSGKSTGLHVICAAIALDPSARMFVIDPSGGVELGQWEPVADGFAETGAQSVALLRALFAEMERELARMRETQEERRAAGLPARNVGRGEQTTWIVIDELLALTNNPDKNVKADCCGMLQEIVGRGRKVGFHVVASTLRPTGDVIPTSLRDLVQYREAYRCTTSDASDSVLGKGWASRGFGGHRVSGKVLGESFLLAQGAATPIRKRGVYLSEAELDEVVEVALRLRGARPAVAPPARPSMSLAKSAPVVPGSAAIATPVPSYPEPPARAVALVPDPTPTPAPAPPPVDPDVARRAHNANQFAGRRRRSRPGSDVRRRHPAPTEEDLC